MHKDVHRIECPLEQQVDLEDVAAVQRNGGKLAYILDAAIPREAVVHVGNYAQVTP